MPDVNQSISEEDFREAFEGRAVEFRELQKDVVADLEKALEKAKINFIPIMYRVKDIESAIKKWGRKRYENPLGEMTDIVGLRVVVYLDTDVDRVRRVVEKTFFVDKRTVDKRLGDSEEKFGYQSLHLICSRDKDPVGDLSWDRGASRPFEIQVSTALQHAWAAIEHKLSYKSEQSLPSKLKRRLLLASAALEIIDREILEIKSQSDIYVKSAIKRPAEPITGIALVKLIGVAAAKHGVKLSEPSVRHSDIGRAVVELRDFGVRTIEDFSDLVERVADDKIKQIGTRSHVSFVRHLMIFDDPSKYLKYSYQRNYNFNKKSVERLGAILDADFSSLLSENNIRVI